jgi:predicted dehydrogenase
MDFYGTYAHTPLEKMFNNKDVYGIAYDEERASKRKIKLGIIGVGGVAQSKHIPAICRLRTIWEPVELTAFSTRNNTQADKINEIYGCRYYSDYKEMLNEEQLDGVIICSCDEAHFEHTMACFEREIAVLTEKPLSRNIMQSQIMVNTAEEHGDRKSVV